MLSRADTHKAYLRHRAIHEAHEWHRLHELFADDARYFDGFFGWTEGREAIGAFLKQSMSGLEGWEVPIHWEVVGEGRVVVHWCNRLPGRRPDGSYYEFFGVSTLRFDDDGLIAEQMDIYDRFDSLQVIASARTGLAGRVVARVWNKIGTALLHTSHRVVVATE